MTLTDTAGAASDQMRSFELIERLGYGGMAEVWLARRRSPSGQEPLVALKRLLPHLRGRGQLVNMLLDEARIASRIVHPNVVRILGSGHEGPVFYIVMEYLDGVTLARFMGEAATRNCPSPPHVAAFIVTCICHGLHHAHEQTDEHGHSLGIVHRDVSPQNTMLLYDGSVKLLDFGIARARDRVGEPTSAGALKGKYGYLSPEQCNGTTLDRRADIHACGIILWELLSGRRLFKESDPIDSVRRIQAGDVSPPSRFNEAIPPALEKITLKALATEPGQRYQTALAMALQLDEYLDGTGLDGAADLAAYLERLLSPQTRIIPNGLEGKLTSKQWLDRVPLAPHLDEPTMGSTTAVSITCTGDDEISDIDLPQSDLGLHSAPTAVSEADLPSFDARTVVSVTAHVPPTDLLPARGPRSRRRWFAVAVPLALALAATWLLWPSGQEQTATQPWKPRVHVASADDAASTDMQMTRLSTVETAPDASIERELSVVDPRGTHATDAGVLGRRRMLKSGGDAAIPHQRSRRPSRRRPSSPRSTTAPAQSAKRGWLNLATEPWTAIYRGKVWLGNTPLVRAELPAGTINLRAVNRRLGVNERVTVTIVANEVTRRSIRFKR